MPPTDDRSKNALRTLILTLRYPNRASYYDDWCDAFIRSSHFDSTVRNILTIKPHELARELPEYDAFILLHSTNSDTLEYLAAVAPALGARSKGKLIAFAGNEYNSPYVSLPEKVRLLKEAGCDAVATQLLLEAGEFLYGGLGCRVVAVPHALNPAAFSPGPEHGARRLDLGVKGFRYPAYLGDEDRNYITQYFMENVSRFGLKADISEDSRLSRSDWAAFLASCRGTISTETGSWYLERDDDRVKRIHAYLSARRSGVVISNESRFRRLARHLPSPVKSLLWTVLKRGPIKFEVLDDFNTPFAEIEAEFFRGVPRSTAYGKAVSSRHFDAIGTKTCQIMLRGRFNDILEADRHYIAIDPDFANIDQAIERFKDEGVRQRMVDETYEFAMDAHTHQHRAAELRRMLDEL